MIENNSKRVCILIIEDNPGDVEIIQMALRNAAIDCEVRVIEEGAEAMEFVEGRGNYRDTPAPDLVLLDLNLPKYDGLEILKAMRQRQALSSVPVAVLSSSSSSRDRAKIVGFNVDVYLTKPADLEEYLEIGPTLKKMLDAQ